MMYNKLTNVELSEKLFYAANPDTDLIIFEHMKSDHVSLWDGGEDRELYFFSILDFGDLMPIAIKNNVFYEFRLGDDYHADEYKAVAVFEDCHNHTTNDSNVCRAIAICLLKKFKAEEAS